MHSDPEQKAADLNTVARFLSDVDVQELTEGAVADSVGTSPVDCLVLLGNSVLCTVEAVAEAVRRGVAETVIIVGGEGHSTSHLRNEVRADARYDGWTLDGKSEAEILRDVLARWHGIAGEDLLLGTESTNCGANAEEAYALLETQGVSPDHIVLVQDPTMQLRTKASFRRVWGDERPPLFYSCPTFVPKVTVGTDGLIFEDPDRPGLWSMERFVSLVMGEIPRLRNDENGYGPRGRGYIAAVEIPPQVEAAYDRLLGPFSELVRSPN